jgi:hypothetical protein
MNRRELLAGAAAAAASLALPRAARAIGPGSQLRFGELALPGAPAGLRSSGLERLGWEVAFRTSIDVGRENPVPASLASEKLFESPFLFLAGDRRFALPSPRELEALRRHLTFGGMLLVDSAEGRAGGEFDAAVRALVRELFPPPHPGLVTLPADHVVMKSFYLVRQVAGRVAALPHLEAVILGGGLGGGPGGGGRAAIVYSQNDLAGAWAKDPLGKWAYQCHPGGETQREHAFRLGINLVMYSMCLDYKTDQVHVPFIMRRRRWRVEEAP